MNIRKHSQLESLKDIRFLINSTINSQIEPFTKADILAQVKADMTGCQIEVSDSDLLSFIQHNIDVSVRYGFVTIRNNAYIPI